MQARHRFLTVMTSLDRCPHRTEQLAVQTCKVIHINHVKSQDKDPKDDFVILRILENFFQIRLAHGGVARQNERFRAAQSAEAECEVDGQGRDLVGSFPCSQSTLRFLRLESYFDLTCSVLCHVLGVAVLSQVASA